MLVRSVFLLLVAFAALSTLADDELSHDSIIERQASAIAAVGVVRHFHPHDAVEAVDWSSVLLEAFSLAEHAASDSEFSSGLVDLLVPIGTGLQLSVPEDADIELEASDCGVDDPVIRWVHSSFGAPPLAPRRGIYASRRSISGVEEPVGEVEFSTAAKFLPADDLRTRSLKFSAQTRLVNEGQAALWVRVDGPEGEILFFDNMDDRPIKSSEWSDNSISLDIPYGAEQIHFGVMAMGHAHAQFRSVRLQDVNAASEQAQSVMTDAESWRLFAPQDGHEMHVDLDKDGFSIDLAQKPVEMQMAAIDRIMPEDAPSHTQVELKGGSILHVPLMLCRSNSELSEGQRQELANRYQAFESAALTPAELARLDVATVWPIVRHFYPYQELVDDWAALLQDALQAAALVTNREDHHHVLKRMLVPLEDGHVYVSDGDPASVSNWAGLPVAISLIEDQLFIVNSLDSGRIRVGDRVVSIDGQPADEWLEDRRPLYSGSPQWQTKRAIRELVWGERGQTRELVLEQGDESTRLELEFDTGTRLPGRTHDTIWEPGDGIIYVDLVAIDESQLQVALPRLAEAQGVVFDIRGYPGKPAQDILSHLLERDDDWDDWMQVFVARAPGGDLVETASFGWHRPAIEPRIEAPVAFLSDANALSYPESVLGLVKYHGLGTIVGSSTGGSNGNVLSLSLPGNFRVSYTGMRVIGPDGEPFQGQGLKPDVEVHPTVEGLLEGRDEVLERALEVLDREQ